MFEKFGEFGSAEELNEKAAEFRSAGKIEDLKALALENGFMEDDVMDYLDEPEDAEFCSVEVAAVGKLEVEKAELEPVEIVADWFRYIVQLCMEDAGIAAAVRSKGKSLKGCVAHLLRWSFENMYDIDGEIKKLADVSQNVKMGIPGMARAKMMIKDYYGEVE